MNRQRAQLDGQQDRTARDLEKTEREIRRLIEAIKSGVPGTAVKDEMAMLEAKRGERRAQLEAAPPSLPRLHPNLGELYRQKVIKLAEALNEEPTRLEATQCVRELIKEIRLVPDKGKLRIDLYGELAALINLANKHPRSREAGAQVAFPWIALMKSLLVGAVTTFLVLPERMLGSYDFIEPLSGIVLLELSDTGRLSIAEAES